MANSNDDTLFLGQFSLLHVPFEVACAAAAAAGFTGISLFWTTLSQARASGRCTSAIRAGAEAAGLRVVQLEFASPVPRAELASFRDTAAEMAQSAAALGCDSIHAVALDRSLDFGDVAESLAVLAQACDARSLRCGLEFVPFLSAVETLPDALRVIRAVSADNLGIVLDALHFQRGGAQWDALETMAARELTTFQLDDGPLRPPDADYAVEATELRRLPGAGEIDLVRMIQVLERIGCTECPTVEVASAELNATTPEDACRRMADSARALLSRARS